MFEINWPEGKRSQFFSIPIKVRFGWEAFLDRQMSRLEKKLREWLISPFNAASAVKTDTKTRFHHCLESNSLGL